ncbi:hypothetical protein NDA11_004961 [Ustilago hordei]|uniref:protein-tyrosine-phosphatase n=1 Tax=Ustilago hordei TaxID=120017 RepID=I2FXX1_USTHO|nr:uncharacterized protein UHO2_00253 [Ustilago hordei]KAJ1041252.1 hypothetical protein NDA10_001176 [Ustilago hordei]KAJ1570861.1 hypothetical protein NDA11_004961 [Ustilago hordei]KAJ1587424.1 hypothetical protein NDA15_005489 [Ustilago hordei]KAJ1589754.1 hypothetical protein NDA12_000562 [Ustilago hordei]KAJ1602008.1 hypothetical protein NDA14_000563 [Ustilago hordei]
MGKSRFSEIVSNVIRVHQAPRLQRRRSCRASTTFTSPHPLQHGVRSDVHTMAASAAVSPVDDPIRSSTPFADPFCDPFWQPDSLSRRNSALVNSALASPAIGQALAQALASPVCDNAHRFTRGDPFLLRSDVDPHSHPTLIPASSTLSHLQVLHSSPEQLAKPSSAVPLRWSAMSPFQATSASATPASSSQSITASPSRFDGGYNSSSARPTRPDRPTLTRLNTSEMLRTQTETALDPAPSSQPIIGPSPQPIIGPSSQSIITTRKSPTGLKLQLDTSVPRRSATLSSYPHPSKSKQKNFLHLPMPMLTPPTPMERLKPRSHDKAVSENTASSSTAAVAADSGSRQSDAHLGRSDFNLEEFTFEVSTILPDFLYLGPNVQSEQNVAELQHKGIRRILNVACEIDERGPLNLRDKFDKYLKIPMLDSVEAKGVQDSIQEACSFLDDARLRSEPVYVHCKAGKSRSVTIVIAYLIHALGWSLQRSYSHVMEKRAAICPNIGFVAELMKYEEKEHKLTRSSGIYGEAPAGTNLPTSKSSTHLLSAWSDDKADKQARPNESAPALPISTLKTQQLRASQDHRPSDYSYAFSSSQSQSSPDLPSLAFSSR